jgi:hypothetical protein
LRPFLAARIHRAKTKSRHPLSRAEGRLADAEDRDAAIAVMLHI